MTANQITRELEGQKNVWLPNCILIQMKEVLSFVFTVNMLTRHNSHFKPVDSYSV